MKTAYKLAMERLGKNAPVAKLTAAQKRQLGELDSQYAAKVTRRVTKSSLWSNLTGWTQRQFSTSTVKQVLLMMAGFGKTLPITRAPFPSKPVSSRNSRTPVATDDSSNASIMPPGISSSTV